MTLSFDISLLALPFLKRILCMLMNLFFLLIIALVVPF